MQETILAIIEELGLKKPVDIKMSTRKSKIAGLYEPIYSDSGRLKSHKITIWLSPDNNRSLRSLIAHELIHAWQEEKKIADIHGQPFQEMAEYISEIFKIRDIYNSICDD